MNKIRVSLHFSLHEFACPCCERVMLDERLLERLEALRVLWGKPLYITSGYRCEKHNKEVGGAKNSLHMRGQAVDIAVPVLFSEFCELAERVGFFVLPHPERGYVHIDIRKLLAGR